MPASYPMKLNASDSSSVAQDTPTERPSRHTVIAVVALVSAAWVISGGCGLLGRPFASGLTWCALGIIGLAMPPQHGSSLRVWGVFGFALLAPVMALASASDAVRLAGIAVCAATLSTIDRAPLSQRLLRLSSQAVAVLSLYRFAVTSIPVVWHGADATASLLGESASALWGRPISVGPTFAGLDHLVVMGVLVLGWAIELERPRLRPVLIASAAIAIGQAIYLLGLSMAFDLASAVPVAPVVTPPDPYVPPHWFWGNAVRAWLPWNVPVLAVMWHSVVIVGMLRLGRYRSDSPAEGLPVATQFNRQAWACVAVAAVLPAVSMLSLGKCDLTEKTILAFDQGYLDWDVPVHDRYGADSSGRFGMLPTFVTSLGGRLQRSTELTPEELANADVLLLIHPNQPWSAETIARIHDYVRKGGSLLVAAGPRLQDSMAASSHNEILEPLGMPVRFDTTISQTEGWRHALQTGHPAAMGLGDDRDRFGMGAAASIQMPWHATPVLVGRWGWSDSGSDYFLTGLAQWDATERLGDLVLAAERRLGAGRIVVLGDNACLTNQGNIRSYRFTGRLLSYLAHRTGSPQSWWRQLAGLALAAALVFFWIRPIRGEVLAISCLVFLLAHLGVTMVSCRSWEVYPDGRRSTPNNLAYIDASHLEAYAESPWKPYGVDGLALTLMRNGYLVLAADDLSADRLRQAGMLVSIAPAKRFTGSERKRVSQFVEDGGVFICMAGAMHGRKANEVLKAFGMRVPKGFHRPGTKNSDALPLGCRYRPYPDGDPVSAVVFHAAWPVAPFGSETTSLASAEGAVPGQWEAIITEYSSRGVAILIGDTCFAVNKTLEKQDGGTLTGDHVNAYFWRWLLGQLPGHEPWQPPPYDWNQGKAKTDSTASGTEATQP